MTINVDSLLIEKTLRGGADTSGYSRNKILIANITTQGADSVSSVSVTNAGSAYTGIPTISFTGDGAAAAAAAVMKALTGIIAAAGTGYVPADTITLFGGTHSIAAILTVATTRLVTTNINAAGTGYLVGDTITLAGGTHSAAAVVTVASVSSGAVSSFSITTPGSYTVNSATFTQASTSGIGTGATFNSSAFGVNTVTVSTAGSYTVLPGTPVQQDTSSGSGTGATFTLTWGVLSVTVTNGGHDYSMVPTVSFSGGAGSGAAATAVIGGTDDPVTISLAFATPLPTAAYAVKGMPSQAAVISSSNKTLVGVDITLTPLDGGTLVGGTLDAIVEFIN